MKNILYFKRGYAFRIVVVNKTYVIKLLGLLIPPGIRFSKIYFLSIHRTKPSAQICN